MDLMLCFKSKEGASYFRRFEAGGKIMLAICSFLFRCVFSFHRLCGLSLGFKIDQYMTSVK